MQARSREASAKQHSLRRILSPPPPVPRLGHSVCQTEAKWCASGQGLQMSSDRLRAATVTTAMQQSLSALSPWVELLVGIIVSASSVDCPTTVRDSGFPWRACSMAGTRRQRTSQARTLPARSGWLQQRDGIFHRTRRSRGPSCRWESEQAAVQLTAVSRWHCPLTTRLAAQGTRLLAALCIGILPAPPIKNSVLPEAGPGCKTLLCSHRKLLDRANKRDSAGAGRAP